MPVQDIAVQDLLRVPEPIWREKTETAKRLHGHIEAVLFRATVSGHRTGDNPGAGPETGKNRCPPRPGWKSTAQ